MAEQRLRHMKWPVSRTKRISDLIRHHMFPAFSSSKGARKFLNRVGDHADDLMVLRHADQYGKGTDEYQDTKTPVDHMKNMVEGVRAAGSPTALSGLAINGNDLIAAGVPRGPMMGQILNSLMGQVVENPELNSREALLGLVQGQLKTAAMPTNAYDYLIHTLGMREEGKYFYDAAGARMQLALDEQPGELVIEEIQIVPQGTGLGSRVVEALQDYAQETGKYLEVHDAQNEEFWAKWNIPQA
jgi:hypothetical protein